MDNEQKYKESNSILEKVKKWIDLQDLVVLGYLFLMFVAFPLAMHNKLFDITETKYLFAKNVTSGAAFLYICIHIFKKDKLAFMKLRWFDFFGIGFLVLTVISTMQSDYRSQALTGISSRNIGMLTSFLYVYALWMLISNAKCYLVALYWFEIGGAIVGVLAILNQMWIDPLGVYTNMAEESKYIMNATIGNIGLQSVYMGILFVLAAGMSLFTEEKAKRRLHMIVMGISGYAVVTSGADMGYIAILIYILGGWIILTSVEQWSIYLESILILAVEHYVFRIMPQLWPNLKYVTGICVKIAYASWLLPVIGCLVILTGISILMGKRSWKLPSKVHVVLKKTALLVLIFSITAGIMVWIWVNFVVHGNVANRLLAKLYITQDWGTLRGAVWQACLEEFQKLSWQKKLLGTGPDTLGYAMDANWNLQLFLAGRPSFNVAHNTFLQLLLTHGVLATICYYVWLLGTFVEIGRKGEQNPVYYVLLLAVLAYEGTTLFNINTVFIDILPLLIIGLARGEITPLKEIIKSL